MSLNLFKLLIHNIQAYSLSNIQAEKQRKDEEQACLKLGGCDVQAQSPKKEELYLDETKSIAMPHQEYFQ